MKMTSVSVSVFATHGQTDWRGLSPTIGVLGVRHPSAMRTTQTSAKSANEFEAMITGDEPDPWYELREFPLFGE